jgi:hypothetical protein
VITDAVPRTADERRDFKASDERWTLPLPPPQPFQSLCAALKEALSTEDRKRAKQAGLAVLGCLAEHHGVPCPKLSVLGARPKVVHNDHSSYELFGDYTFASQTIRLWMRTAVLGKVTSYRGFLNTLLHEYAHHLDVRALGFPNTPHTRGFYQRVDDLYHLALGTPADERRPLTWIKTGTRYRIDWTKLRAPRKG